MIDKLSESLHFRQEALNLHHERQKVLAANMANADTPGYKARDFDFGTALRRATGETVSGRDLPLRTSSSSHLSAPLGDRLLGDLLYRVPEQPTLDGNTVDMERERVRFADHSVRYQASISFMNSQIVGLKKAMQPE